MQDNDILKESSKHIKAHRHTKRWRRCVTALSCLVVFLTVYALVMPAITMTGEVYCGVEEHTHTDDCYERTLTCTLGAEAAHTHTDACYETRSALACGLEEGAAEPHTHTAACYQEERVLICQQEEAAAAEHQHTDECYEKALVCPLEEHQHSLACYSDPEADLETAALWEQTLPQERTGNWREDLLAVARSQVGYAESSSNFAVDENGLMHGYTRYGALLGDPYGDWSASFVVFCLHYAGVPQEAFPYGADCAQWQALLAESGLCVGAAAEPQAGCLAFFDGDGDGAADRMGVIAETDGTDGGFTVIEGDANGCVAETRSSANDSALLCYALLPEGADAGSDAGAGTASLLEELPDGALGGTFLSAEGNELTWTAIPDGNGEYELTISGEGAMPDCTKETYYNFPWNADYIKLCRVVIGDGITRIGSYAFYDMNGAFSLKIGSAVEEIGEYAFGYTYVTKVNIPSNVKRIESYAFAWSDLREVSFAEGLEEIGDYAFYAGENRLGAAPVVRLPASLKSVQGRSFAWVRAFEVAEGSESYTAVDGVLYSRDMTSLISFPKQREQTVYRIPDSVTSVASGALSSVKRVQRLVVPSSISSFPGQVFSFSNYREIYFENGTAEDELTLGNNAFYNLKELTSIHFPENTKLTLKQIYLYDTVTNIQSLEIPNGTVEILSNFFPNTIDRYGMIGLETLRYNAADCYGINKSADNILGPDASFALTIGEDVDQLRSGFRYFVEHATSIAFERENQLFAVSSVFENAPAPFNALSGFSCIYVDAQGVVYGYRAVKNAETGEYEGTATVISVPADAVAVTIPKRLEHLDTQNGEKFVDPLVTEVSANALCQAERLRSINFEAPENITKLGAYALGNCPTLTSVNGENSVEGAQSSFTNAALEMGYRVFYNTGLVGSAGGGAGDGADMDGEQALTVSRDGAASMLVSVSSKGETLRWVDDGTTKGYRLLTGDTMTITASVGNTQGSEDFVYRLYFRKGGEKCSLSIQAGASYTFDGNSVACLATDDPGVVCLSFRPTTGKTISIPVTAVYPSPASSGGALTVWGEILTEGEAQSGSALRAPDQKIDAYWKTSMDSYELQITANKETMYFTGDGEGAVVPGGDLSCAISMDRSSEETSAYGKDVVRSVDYTDVLTLPEGMYWNPAVLEAIRADEAYVSGYYVYAGGIQIATVTSSFWTGRRVSLSEDGKNVVFHWRVTNRSTETELGSASGNITVSAGALRADPDVIGDSVTVQNTVTARLHYTYSADCVISASDEREILMRNGEIRLTKTASGGSYFGEDASYSIRLSNVGALTWTQDESDEFIYFIHDELDKSLCISVENMQRMLDEFTPEEAGANLQIKIVNAHLAAWQPVTAADGASTAYRTVGNSNLEESLPGGITLVVRKKTDEGHTEAYRLTGIINGEKQYFYGDTVAEALRKVGYACTSDTTFACDWVLNDAEETLSLLGGETREYNIYATAKNTFAMVQKDELRWYPTDNAVAITNSASLAKMVAGGSRAAIILRATSKPALSVKREARIEECVYNSEGKRMKSSISASDGDVLTYELEFTHHGAGAYDDLPMVDDLYGSQYLLVPAKLNGALSGLGLAETEDGGVTYYKLKEGSYTDVAVGIDGEGNTLVAASITVSRSDTEQTVDGDHSYVGLHTQIKWYFKHLDGGDYSRTVQFKAGVDLRITGGKNASLGNIVWMNDKTDKRIYAVLWGGGSMIDYEKKIVEARGGAPESDRLDEDDYSLVAPGDTVTYRLALKGRGAAASENHITGADFLDALPETYGIFSWERDKNVSIEVVVDGDAVCTGMDDWSIKPAGETGSGMTGSGSCICWPETTELTIHGGSVVYLYVTLTFPSGSVWSSYTGQNGGRQVNNTFYVYGYSATVLHDLKESGRVLLQKGVYALMMRDNARYWTSGSDRQHYANKDNCERVAFYYVMLYNGGSKRLYLNDLQDQLPEGFAYSSLREDSSVFDAGEETVEGIRLLPRSRITTRSGAVSRFVTAEDTAAADGIRFLSASVTAYRSEEDSGKVTFRITGTGSSDSVQYDSARRQYYLGENEAVVFLYEALIGEVQETQETAVNAVAMPYTDYLESGASVIGKSSVPVDAAAYLCFADHNDGTRAMLSADTVKAQYGFTDKSGSAQWLVSTVPLARGRIVPGVTKYTESYTSAGGTTEPYTNSAGPKDVVNWRVRVQNTGTMSMTDYTVTDILPAPYVFTGEISYMIYNEAGKRIKGGGLLAFPERTGTEETVAASNRYVPALGANLKVNGDEIRLGTTDFMFVALLRDENGNEGITLHFKSLDLSIPEGGWLDITYSSLNPTSAYVNSVYTNQVLVTPNSQRFDAAGQGSIVRDADGRAQSVRNSAPLTVSFGFATSSEKSVTEAADETNRAVSTSQEENWILLSSAESVFRYTLAMNNDTDQAISRLVLIDNLPDEDDHSPFDVSALRGSAFKVCFAEDPAVAVTVTAADGTKETLGSEYYTVEYSRWTDFGGPQSPDWKGATTAKWDTSPAEARSIRVVINDAGRTKLPAKAKIEVSFNAAAAEGAPSEGIAWNSFGYHYKLAEGVELEAMPLAVGVKLPPVPTLQKQLVDVQGQSAAAPEDTVFSVLIYEGEALPDSYATAAEWKAALEAQGRSCMETALTVRAGETASETVILKADGFCWTDGARYTAVELPCADARYRTDGFNGAAGESWTFTYSAEEGVVLVCRNTLLQWSLALHKVDTADNSVTLSGAVFALYSPDAADEIAVPEEYDGCGVQQRQNVNGEPWYLCAVQTTGEDGTITWKGLLQERYYLLEAAAPDGYALPESPGEIVTRDSAAQGVSSVTVANDRQYALPDSGGAGTVGVYGGGALLLAGAGLLLVKKRRLHFGA